MNDLDPARTALLLMDVQNGIVGRHPDVAGFVAGLGRARAAARDAGLTVGYVRVALTAEERSAAPAGSRFASEQLDADGPATQFHPALHPAEGEVVVRKKRFGAFSTTDLAEQLAARGIDTLVLAGVSTSGVVLSTVRDATDRDYRLLVLEDGCWDADQQVHAVLTGKVFPRAGVTVTTIDGFVEAVGLRP
ncbi:cysteine hydrolase [Leifsonia sp. F6_8S_P_1B]|uniref:Cysteine hydrolase n=1 Tax=Leifsonia williamsii TaxID=3035919 RepID=A0ABT8K7G2_9MICO|nr:cysteine hydrolase [Leifsonia williamsii]MDN4613391.1 cysteine hydrolase [Leifsonia williamsii]